MENRNPTTQPQFATNNLQVIIVGQDETLYEGEADSIIAPGKDNINIGILPFHTPFYTKLYKGKLSLVNKKDKQEFDIEGGVVRVINNSVIILVGF